MAQVIGVVGGSGGVGASTFAAVLAASAAAAGSAMLVDLDVCGGGVDVLLGIESADGARWSGLRVAGGRLDPQLLLDGLPRWRACAVLAADLAALAPDAVLQVLDAAGDAVGTVVLDLPRAQCAERAAGLLRCDLVVVLARCDWPGLVAAHATLSALPELPVGVVVRRGEVAVDEAAAMVATPLLGTLPALGAPLPKLVSRRLPRATARVASGVLDGLRRPVLVPVPA